MGKELSFPFFEVAAIKKEPFGLPLTVVTICFALIGWHGYLHIAILFLDVGMKYLLFVDC